MMNMRKPFVFDYWLVPMFYFIKNLAGEEK